MDFEGRYDLAVSDIVEAKPWNFTPSEASRSFQLRQYSRVQGIITLPAQAVMKNASVRVMDPSGTLKASLTIKT